MGLTCDQSFSHRLSHNAMAGDRREVREGEGQHLTQNENVFHESDSKSQEAMAPTPTDINYKAVVEGRRVGFTISFAASPKP